MAVKKKALRKVTAKKKASVTKGNKKRPVGRPRKKPAAKKPKKRLLTRRELAAKLGVYMDTITKWEKSGLPISEPGRPGQSTLYELRDVQKWRKDREKAAHENGSFNVQQERARKERAQALVAEQTLEVRSGELMRADDVADTWHKEIAAVRGKFLAWPATMSDQLGRAFELGGVRALEEKMTEGIHELLTELSEGK